MNRLRKLRYFIRVPQFKQAEYFTSSILNCFDPNNNLISITLEKTIHEGSPKTPSIKVNGVSGVVDIVGRSNPENSSEFYNPLIKWMDEYIENPAPKTTLNLNLEHFNTSSSKCILDLLKRIKRLDENGKEIVINWYYEDDDEEMLETAEIYEGMTGLKFKKIPIPE